MVKISSTVLKIICTAALTDVAYHVARKLYRAFFSEAAKISRDSLTSSLNKRFNKRADGPEEFHRVLFFPDPGIPCHRLQSGRVCKDKTCAFYHDETSLSILAGVMKLTRKTLDVCIYLFTSTILADALIECNERGVIVRIITDDRNSGEIDEVSSTQIGKLRAAGIQVRCHASSFWMHHKYMVADSEISVTGSLNWTNQGVMGNCENVSVTSKKELVVPFIKDFNEMWNKLKPVPRISV